MNSTRMTRTRQDARDGNRREARPNGIRLAPVVWMAVLALFIVGVGILPAAGDPVAPRPGTSVQVTVRTSDTLWKIASEHRLPGVSTAQMVRLIRDANAVDGNLACGSVLQIPAAPVSGTAYAQVSGPDLAN
jgi:hypothetical protein